MKTITPISTEVPQSLLKIAEKVQQYLTPVEYRLLRATLNEVETLREDNQILIEEIENLEADMEM